MFPVKYILPVCKKASMKITFDSTALSNAEMHEKKILKEYEMGFSHSNTEIPLKNKWLETFLYE